MPHRAARVVPVLAVVVLAVVAAAPSAAAQPTPTWADTPALIAAATAPVDADLRACFARPGPRRLALIAARDRDGHTTVALPMPNVGYRGLTPEDRCLAAAVGRVTVPPLPAELDRVVVAHDVTAAGDPPPAVEAAFTAWRDPAATVAATVDAAHRASLAACDRRARTVRVVLDLRRGATRAWLPAWQFHSRRGDGTTPPAQRRVKACLARAIRAWQVPTLPRAMAELHLALAVEPAR